MCRNVEIGHEDFGKAVLCECLREAQEFFRVDWARHLCGLPPAMARMSLGTFDAKRLPGSRKALEAVKAWLERPGWLVLTGTYGVGKTHLAGAATNDLLRRGEHVVFTYVKSFYDRMRQLMSTPDGYMPFLDATKAAPFLILDDLGVERQTDWVVEQAEDLFNYRADHLLPTLVTTNKSMDDIASTVSPRIHARLKRLATVVVMA